jgi:hypothetical protein
MVIRVHRRVSSLNACLSRRQCRRQGERKFRVHEIVGKRVCLWHGSNYLSLPLSLSALAAEGPSAQSKYSRQSHRSGLKAKCARVYLYKFIMHIAMAMNSAEDTERAHQRLTLRLWDALRALLGN